MNTQISHLDALEAESIHIFREVAAEFEKPVLLFSGGKDSIVMLRLAEKAFWPARIPFALMHVDTGHNFPEVIEFRDRRVAELGVHLVVASVQESIDEGRVVEERGPRQPQPAADHHPARRHHEQPVRRRVRWRAPRRGEGARRRSGSTRSATSSVSGTRRTSDPSCGASTTARHRKGEHIRVFPLSNWTELDIWQYIDEEGIEVPSIYFAHHRPVFRRDGMLLAVSDFVTLLPDEEPETMLVRYRTVGDASCTGAVESSAATVHDIILEVAASRITERGATRADDRFTEAAMEDRKREGYF